MYKQTSMYGVTNGATLSKVVLEKTEENALQKASDIALEFETTFSIFKVPIVFFFFLSNVCMKTIFGAVFSKPTILFLFAFGLVWKINLK